MKMNQLIRRGFTLVELLVVIVIIAALAGLTAPQVIKMKKKGDLAEATNNAKQLGLGFAQFDSDIGGYPDDSTVEAVEGITGETSSRTLTGSNSNAYFRQLLEAGIIESEQPFYCRTSYTKKPDDVLRGEKALEAGEVGFGYVMALQGKAITTGAGRPIVAAPLREGSSDGVMESEPYDGKSIVLFTDNSVRQLNIRKSDSKAILPSRKHIIEGGSEDSIWGATINPIIVAPLPK